MDTIRLPHHRLLAYGVALELLRGVRDARIRDAHLREQALRAAKSACLNCAEGAGRVSRADKARVFAIARAEASEAAAAVEIAVAAGDANAEALGPVLACADRFVAMMTGLIRPSPRHALILVRGCAAGRRVRGVGREVALTPRAGTLAPPAMQRDLDRAFVALGQPAISGALAR